MDPRSDENGSHLLPSSPDVPRTILDGWIDAENYFFEWVTWLGFAIYGLAFPTPWSLMGLLGQAVILVSILRVTGIPPTESHALRSKGEAYRDYQRRVSKFIPLPPKTGT